MVSLCGYAYTETALESLAKIEPKKVRAQIVKHVEALLNDPTPPGSKQLNGPTDGECPVYRIRSGDYRILYSLRSGRQIVVLDIGNRKDVYRSTGG